VSESERRQRTISSTPRLTPDEVASRAFPTAFRGISESDVRAFLKRVAEDLSAVRVREQDLANTIDELEARLRTPKPLDEQELLDALGEETTRLLRSAREAASDIRGKAEERAARLVHDAHEEAQRLRQEANDILGVRTQEAESVTNGMLEEAEQRASDLMRVADERAVEVRTAADRYAEETRARGERESATQIDGAREQGRSLVDEATSLRQRVIDDLARRRELLTGQLEELRTGRDELLDAYRIVKRTFLEATEALAQVEARATAGRSAAGADPADLADTLASEAEATRVAGLEPAASAVDAAAAEASATEPTVAEPTVDEPSSAESTVAVPTVAEPSVAESLEAMEEPEAATLLPEEPDIADGEDGDLAPNLADVDDLFARLRAGAQAETDSETDTEEPAPASAAASAAPEAEIDVTDGRAEPSGKDRAEVASAPGATAPEGAADEVPAWLSQRDEVLTPLRVALVRQVKLAIGNEQNEVLDKVRRHKGRLVAASALPEVEAQTAAWSAVVISAATDAYRLGRGSSDAGASGDAAVPDDLAADLARAMVEPLRDRLVATIDAAHEPGETSSQVAERIGARYREWKSRSAESSADDVLVAAYARGHYDATADGAVLTWCVPPPGCCVDCADNALEPTRKGEDFPTGQAYPPAHPGCRCALVSDETAGASGAAADVGSTSSN
jgi:DivIVA domain-containing protein